jgi:hypothetical protein
VVDVRLDQGARFRLVLGEALLLKVQFPDLFLEAREVLDEEVDDLGVEVRARAAQEQRLGLLARHPAPVGAVLAHGVEAVNHGEDARGQRNLLAAQRVRVALAVPHLVVMPNDRHDRVREFHALQNLRADGRVHLHALELGRGQPSRLVQDVVGDGELAHVVEQGPGLEGLYLVAREAEDAAHAGGVNLHAADVVVRRLVFGVNGGGERLDRRQVQSAEGVGLARLLVDALEEGLVGRVGRGDDGDAQEHVEEAEGRQRAVDEAGGRGRGDEGERRPEVAVAPEAAERAALPQRVHGGKREAVQDVVRRRHRGQRHEQLVRAQAGEPERHALDLRVR